jgi:predicted porin
MRRKAAALAVGALFMAPAAHAQIVFGNPQLGTLQVYGKLYPQFGYGSSKDATTTGTSVSTLVSPTAVNNGCGTASSAGACTGTTPGSRRSVDVQNSYIGFRGERDIPTYGLKFIWQIETATEFDTGTGQWSSRNSFVGARTAWGTVKLGNMDTIYKEYGDTMQMFGISSGNFVSASNMLSQIGVGRSTAARFHERKNNSIQYETPTFSGFTFGYQYSPDEARDTQDTVPSGGCTTGPGAGNCGRDAALHSYGVKWDSEKFYASVHQEVHQDFFGGSNNVSSTLSNAATNGAHSQDIGTRFSAEWRFMADQRFVLDIARLKYRETGQVPGVSAATARFESYAHTNWAIGWDGGFGGPWRFATQYIRGGEGECTLTFGSCSTTGLRSYMVTAGVRYRFDRQTFVYLIGAKLNNGPSARYDNWADADPARGADILQTALGVSYTF